MRERACVCVCAHRTVRDCDGELQAVLQIWPDHWELTGVRRLRSLAWGGGGAAGQVPAPEAGVERAKWHHLPSPPVPPGLLVQATCMQSAASCSHGREQERDSCWRSRCAWWPELASTPHPCRSPCVNWLITAEGSLIEKPKRKEDFKSIISKLYTQDWKSCLKEF